MFIDLVYAGIVLFAIIQGFRKGLIVGLFSLIATIAGLAAAIKLSAYVAGRLGEVVNFSEKLLPVLSFVLVFIAVVFIIRLVAVLIQKLAETMMLGLLNRMGGVLMYLLIHTIIFSIQLFYIVQLGIINPTVSEGSFFYPFLEAIGPWTIEGLGKMMPFFSSMFEELKEFFGGLAPEEPLKALIIS